MNRTWPEPQWAVITLVFSLLMAGHLAEYLPDLWVSPWSLVQDDARHFVVWLRRLADPALFPDDPIERFFRSVTPASYAALYRPAAWSGVDVVRWHVLVVIPTSVLLFLYAADRFAVVILDDAAQRALLVVGAAVAFHHLYGVGLPRSFGPAITMLALAAWAMGHRWRLAATMAVGANLYPVAAATVGIGILVAEAARTVQERRVDRTAAATLAVAAGSGLAGLSLFLLATGDSGPAMTLEQAERLPIFHRGGRSFYFDGDLIQRLSCGRDAGLLPVCNLAPWWTGFAVTFGVIFVGLRLVPARAHGPRRLLVGLCVAGLVLFAVASVVALRAHLPTRYAHASIHFVFRISWIATLAIALTTLARRFGLRPAPIWVGLLVLVATWTPRDLGRVRFVVRDRYPAISAALRALPKDALVAGMTPYTDSVPAFSSRSVYAAVELSIPYKREYYETIAARVRTLFQLYTQTRVTDWIATHRETEIDVYLVTRAGSMSRRWRRNFPDAPRFRTATIFEREANASRPCVIASQDDLSLIHAECFVNELRRSLDVPVPMPKPRTSMSLPRIVTSDPSGTSPRSNAPP